MKKVIKIIGTEGGYPWYLEKEGEEYELEFMDENTGDYVVNLNNSKGDLGSVKAEHTQVREVAEDVEVRKFVKIPTKLDTLEEENKLLKEEIETLQGALDEIIINLL